MKAHALAHRLLAGPDKFVFVVGNGDVPTYSLSASEIPLALRDTDDEEPEEAEPIAWIKTGKEAS